MYGTTYVMYVCATAFCGSWKSSYIHEGGGNCFDVLYFGLHIVIHRKKPRNSAEYKETKSCLALKDNINRQKNKFYTHYE